jgi:hypothetical protein
MVLLIRGDCCIDTPGHGLRGRSGLVCGRYTARDGDRGALPDFPSDTCPGHHRARFSFDRDTGSRRRDPERRARGWFFVLQQQPTRPASVWMCGDVRSALTLERCFRGNLAADERRSRAGLHTHGRALKGTTLDNVAWGLNSAQMAFITRQGRFGSRFMRVWLTAS